MTLAWIIDGVVLCLLGLSLWHTTRLHGQIKRLYETRGDLETFLNGLTASLLRAEKSMAGLKKTGETTFSKFGETLQKGQALKDDLAYFLERGEVLANQLDRALDQVRQTQKNMTEPMASKEDQTPETLETLEPEQKEELSRLRSVR